MWLGERNRLLDSRLRGNDRKGELMSAFDDLFSTPAMSAVFADSARLQGMLDFEAALARAQAKLGVIPQVEATCIALCCKADDFDLDGIAQAASADGNHAISTVRQLTQRVAAVDAEAARYVHWGATSQDAIDTGLVLQLRAAFALLTSELDRLVAACATQAQTHRLTPMAGRTWLQKATPISFGLKIAGWLSALLRQRERLKQLQARVLVLQFGGAAGSLSALGADGLPVAKALAEELSLTLPDGPWHAQRDRIAETGCALALLCGTLGKIARDVSLLMQSEVGEVFEPAAAGKGGSSAMPHKRNPVGCSIALAAAMRAPGLAATLLSAMPQEHERGLGNWPAEWETLPELFRLAAASLEQMNGVVSGLEVNAERMREHLDDHFGLIYAEAAMMRLAPKLGRAEAHALVQQLSQRALSQRLPLRQVLSEDSRASAALTPADLDDIFDPVQALGAAGELVDRVLISVQSLGLKSGEH